ncbi:bifunctional nuclease family protein [Psychroflexus tropicus]|uniref:bifunctional nuclease family protein n=1 Tax=Psychroflexus tropicus TaxID=197345 RepID=UPI00036970BA|nr:bifunctional nuclease family protein [Psychroflexus tropicus]
MSLARLSIKGISYSQTQNGAYALLLSDMDSDRQLPIVIGAFEAQSIAIALEKEIKPPRPLTHDLFKSFSDRFGIVIKQVIIHKLVDGIFYSSLVCDRDGVEETIDARTSDAIALALRFEAPIFTYKNILDKAGIYLSDKNKDADIYSSENLQHTEEPDQTEKKSSFKSEFSQMSTKKLNELLEKAVNDEDYERAAKIRDEISKRS